MTAATKPITAEQFFAMGDIGRCELVRGEILHMAPASAEHGGVAAELLRRIANHVMDKKLGKVFAAETGFTIERNPDTTRAPDVAFVRAERVRLPFKRGFFDGAPDLAVEVLSPDDTASEVLEKVDQWLAAGAVSVWVVNPKAQGIEIYRQNRQVVRLRGQDVLEGEPTLPGFELRISDLYELGE